MTTEKEQLYTCNNSLLEKLNDLEGKTANTHETLERDNLELKHQLNKLRVQIYQF